MRIPTATLGLAALAAAVLQGVNAFLLPSAPRSSTTSSTTSVVARVPQQQTATIAAPSAARALLSSPMDDFDPAEREAAVAKIKELVGQNKVMLFMKGNKLFPQCGFSNTAVSILRAVDAEFETFDVLSDAVVRDEIKKFSNWPTIPQCYIAGEFVGGSDILLELFESGELETMLADVMKA